MPEMTSPVLSISGFVTKNLEAGEAVIPADKECRDEFIPHAWKEKIKRFFSASVELQTSAGCGRSPGSWTKLPSAARGGCEETA